MNDELRNQLGIREPGFSCFKGVAVIWGHPKNTFFRKLKKKIQEKVRMISQKDENWYIYNNSLVFLFVKKLTPNLDFLADKA